MCSLTSGGTAPARLQVVLNFTGTERQIPDWAEAGEFLLSTLGASPPNGWLRPDEGVILRLAAE